MLQPIWMDTDPMYDKIVNKIRKEYANSCILFIDKVINHELEELYEIQKSDLLIRRNGEVSEIEVFHGTHAKLIDIIAKEGFDPDKNITSAHGKGTYFSTSAKYSSDYMKSTDKSGISYMFISKLLVGKCIFNKTADKENYDNSINQTANPNIYVTPYRYGAIPLYVVAFHKNAKI